MSTFPKPYKEAIEASGLTHEQIAHSLKLSKRRFDSIIYGKGKMDNREFKDIKAFVESMQRTSNGVC